jgi:hypothetical protein
LCNYSSLSIDNKLIGSQTTHSLVSLLDCPILCTIAHILLLLLLATASLASLIQLNKPRPFCLFPVTTLVGYLWLSLPCWLSLNYCLGPRRHSCPFCEHLLKSPQLWLPRESLVSYLGSLVQLPKPFSEVTEDFLSSTNWSLCHGSLKFVLMFRGLFMLSPLPLFADSC